MAFTGFLAAVAASLFVGGVVYLLGHRIGLVDRPDESLKTHADPVVPLGGAAVLVGLHVGLAVADAFDLALLVATVLVWALGLVDDLRGLAPAVRLVGAGAAGLVLALMSDLPEGFGFILIWTLATVVVVNAVNLLDGIDGLAATVSIVSLGGLWWFGVVQGVVGPHFYLVSIGAVLGFIYWNWHPAQLFLGDNGAYVLGVVLTWAALRASPDGTAGLVALAIIGVPLLDMTVTIARRLLAGERLVGGDRDHSYDRLMRSGMSVQVVVLVFVALQAIWSAALLLASIGGNDLLAVGVAVVLGLIVVGVAVLRRGPSTVA
ncbi:MAG: glycosyltransferase family 4 protein [Acidimicrobiia bacterium]